MNGKNNKNRYHLKTNFDQQMFSSLKSGPGFFKTKDLDSVCLRPKILYSKYIIPDPQNMISKDPDPVRI